MAFAERALRVIACATILTLTVALAPRASTAQAAVSVVVLNRHSFIFPAGSRVDSAAAMRVLGAISAATKVRGLPANVIANSSVVVSLGTDIHPDVDAVSYEDRLLIVLPLRRWAAWSNEKLIRVVRHEVGHLGFGVFIGSASIPTWLREGFAEWSAGELTCEYETLIRLDLLGRSNRETAHLISGSAPRGSAQLQAAYFATFVEFLDRGRAVSDGRFLDTVRRRGLSFALEHIFGSSLSSLEADWWRSHLDKFREGLPQLGNCQRRDETASGH